MWREVHNIQFIISLTEIEKGELKKFYNFLFDNKYLIKDNGEVFLSDEGEEYVYGPDNDPTPKILEKLYELDMREGYCWQFAAYMSFKSELNPVEERKFSTAIEKLIEDEILERKDFDNMLVLTREGEKLIKKMFYDK